MSNFQFMRPLYRDSVINASGFPIEEGTKLLGMREKIRSEYGARLLKARKHADLTQTELAKRVGMSQSALAEAETTGQGSGWTAQLAKECGVSPEWLAGNEGEMLKKTGWPGTQFTLDQIHDWPEELVKKVEDIAVGYLTATGTKAKPLNRSGNNPLTVDERGSLSDKLSSETKQGRFHGTSVTVPASKQAKG